MTATAWDTTVGTLVQIEPGSLLLERNIRESKPSPSLVESIKAVGILEPITAVTSPSGLVVRFGHRRTLAALEAGLATVPVYVVGSDDLATDAEVRRVISQFDENTQREALTAADEVGVVEQLVAFGLSADQITAQARVDRKGVEQAIAVSKSKLARKATVKWDALTLDQAAAVAEFEDDTDLAKELIATAIKSPGQFAHTVQRSRDDRARAAAIHAATEALTSNGVKVIARPPYDAKTKGLDHLLDSAGKNLTPKNHATCAGHVAWFNGTYSTEPTYGCTTPGPLGHKERYPSGGFGTGKTAAADMSEADREQAKKARRLVIENNKAWDSAQTVRREWLANLAKQKTPPKGAGAHIASVLGHDSAAVSDYGSGALAYEWLGLKTDTTSKSAVADYAAKATEARALLIALVQVLAAVESMRSRDDWRQNGRTSTAGRHLRFLESIGYDLSDVEKYAISPKTGA